ncbi:dipeptide/oligopeptide/nickel ABC transporter permease/ATP-binding protein [Corynebacterium pseudodiphtheriticum]|uniref:Dipeptide/oligopeptide/nickel ABC transporter permease/ATP-binding protein n=1 Tax=Corynebacterium pseudodiphtheriticum TaxID=37637 RepID=A0AAP4F8J1_9CORY|nr:dipeptide/oligopeptide/nickel ABC transporter permease/ATP-binding protein [Corynebacterium pseudodiphtheriticum]MDK4228677.1 dipeptide/oligopeptide/nickel ABC transporter permease/ATP-binding protein [Corynebacterium pseudodiphtheriticum]MDK4249487.1 dipeptide/oligopeptide/nickel ABC transporter permease/ATP-binding protein [Corynebacterium pseudodiphtheriticum]MDK4273090.1 dipeptide/oligopeptide/nickel ABC transporter permease/ATP-binding protein [Corynebacterium pseudodiphtheriticum]MDK43
MLRAKTTQKLENKAGARFTGLKNLPLKSKISMVVLGLVVLAAVFAPLIAPHDPLSTGTPIQAPSGEHLFGTDSVGRDILSRVIYGARSSLLIGLLATGLALLAAAVLGSIAATSNKVVSEILMRILDIVMSFPAIALAAVFVAVWGNNVAILIIAIGFVYTPQLSRIIRANVLGQFGEDYVSASRVMGASTAHILLKQVARNCIAPVLVFATVLVADAIVLEASLSFINAGVAPPNPSWGNILSDGQGILLTGAWWPTFFAGLMLLITVLCLNIMSEGMTDALASPPARKPIADDAKAAEQAEKAAAVKTLGATSREESQAALEQSLNALRGSSMVTQRREAGKAEAGASAKKAPLLEVKNLRISFPDAHGSVDIIDGVNFSVAPGETLGLVGESGCGKSISAMSIMGLLPNSAVKTGEVLYDGKNVLDLSEKQHNALRGHEIAMIYQDALSSLNPSMLIKAQMTQLIKRGGKRGARELLELVGLDPDRTLKSYPHELSGGQRQRVLIAMALTRNPRLLIADEPTTALDVTVQKQVVELLNDLQKKLGFAMIFVSHDLALVARMADKITVMYAGQVVEQGSTAEILHAPTHEYTRGLLGAVLSVEANAQRLYQIPGTVPSPTEFVNGDRFAPRSSYPELGLEEKPTLRLLGDEATSTHYYASTDELEAVRRGANAAADSSKQEG